MVFPALLSPHSQLQRERPVSCAIRIWRTTMFIGHGRKKRHDEVRQRIPATRADLHASIQQCRCAMCR
jgi:hypothetical protein